MIKRLTPRLAITNHFLILRIVISPLKSFYFFCSSLFFYRCIVGSIDCQYTRLAGISLPRWRLLHSIVCNLLLCAVRFFLNAALPLHKMSYYEALPTDLKPLHYDVSISELNLENDTFEGSTTIFLLSENETSEIYLNFRDLQIFNDQISVSIAGTKAHVTGVDTNEKKEYFVLKLSEVIPKGSSVEVTIVYLGVIQTNMTGVYRSEYVLDGEQKVMISTQFESTDARKAFPCMDEPALKATFTVDLVVPEDWTALGNMPVEEEKISEDSKTKWVKFEKTPLVSTYLVAWAAGEFEYIESFTADSYHNDKPLPVRIYTTKGYTDEAKYASVITPKIVDYFSRIFEVKYPLPKLDLIAVHAYSHNAMENWGLITYRSTALLFSEEKSDPSYKKKVTYVVAHEIAHQWFGNLVTMQWWDELWLNEGFATWVGYNAVDYLFPEWSIFNDFVSESLQQALELDGLRNSHPIQVPVVDALDIDAIFDKISYLKGASAILMISNFLGESTFLKGVAKYLNNNKFGNATSDDLWNSVEEISGKPVKKMMDSWIKKIGFPIVNVNFDQSSGSLILKQSRFLNGGDIKPEEDQTLWWIPLNTVGSVDSGASDFSGRNLTINRFNPGQGAFKLNKDTAGVYRVNYSPEVLKTNILPHFHTFSATDKVGLIADTASIAISGDEFTTTVTFLQLIKTVVEDDKLGEDFVVWLELGNKLKYLSIVFPSLGEHLTAFARSVYKKLSLSLLSTEVPSTEFLKLKLKSLILVSAGVSGVEEIEKYAFQLFHEWKNGKPLSPSLRSFVWSTVCASSKVDEEIFESIMKEVRNPSSLDSREVALGSLGNLSDIALATKVMNYVLDPTVIPTMDAQFLCQSLSVNPKTKDVFLSFFKENYDALYVLLSSNMVFLNTFVKTTLSNYSTKEQLAEIESIFKGRSVHGFDRSLDQVRDNVVINIAWVERDEDKVASWLRSNNY